MSYRTKHLLLMVALFSLLLPLLSSCGPKTAPSSAQQTSVLNNMTPQPHQVGSYSCQRSVHPASSGIASPSSTPRSIYFGDSRGNLYAVNAKTGELRWCIHLNSPKTVTNPCPGRPCPPSASFLIIGTLTVVDGVAYVCISGSSGASSTYAFTISDGSLRWRTQTECWTNTNSFVSSIGPLVNNGVVYSGLYALHAQDGQVLWKTHIDPSVEGQVIPLTMVDGVIYANTEGAIFAITTRDGSIRWHYPPNSNVSLGGPLAISNQMLFFGTIGSVNQPETSALYALNTQNGSLRWYKLMGDYVGTAFLNNVAYVSSRDQYLYALNMNNGTVLWRHRFIYPTYNPALAMNGALYINIDGAYALRSDNGGILWHKPLGTSQSVDFLPSVVVDGVDYLASNDGRGNSILYALRATDGAEYWHSANIPQISPLTVA